MKPRTRIPRHVEDPTTQRVPFFRYPDVFRRYRARLNEVLDRVASDGHFILGPDLAEFEFRLAEYANVRHAVGVGNATDAMEMIVRAVGLGRGDEVVLPSHTFIASASALVMNGVKPVFAEVGSDHLLDPEDIERVLTSSSRAIMPTQLNGRTADMNAFEDIAAAHGLLILEDSAQGLGSRFDGRMAGTFGVAGVYSFYPAKSLGCLGDGGAIITNDAELAAQLRTMRDHGRDPTTGVVVGWGRNSRLDNLQAAVLSAKLSDFESEIRRRRELASRYHKNLNCNPYLILPPKVEATDQRHFDVYQNYEVEADGRDGLREYLSDHGVGTILQWGGIGVHQFSSLGFDVSLPRTERVLSRSLLLPLYPSLTEREVDYVCEQVNDYYDARRANETAEY